MLQYVQVVFVVTMKCRYIQDTDVLRVWSVWACFIVHFYNTTDHLIDVMFFLPFCGSFCEDHPDERSLLLYFTSFSWSQVGLHHAQQNYEDRIYQVDAHHSNQLHELRQRRGVWI